MDSAKQKSGSSRKSSSQSGKRPRHSSSGPVSSSSSNQQQQVPRTLVQHLESNRYSHSTKHQPQLSKNYDTSDSRSSVVSWNSTTGSANDGYSGRNDDYRLSDVQYSRQVRQDHARNLPGPALPSHQRATPKKQIRDYDNKFGGYQPTTVAPKQYSYPRDLEIDS
ncbi:uncharacterized protein LY79DRAFT_594244 [Colletotrichum navitas]|uniref:Uncharacterized protein n=1 Tax=Colletotrichum navitas TaxID=681940 RepID=A0AAD8PMP9_9PEZI|nr:uncharacterized protein LY79DRAFT_594244 [Colletotrichum navitas]KAK1572906.1 hypothetical protein LY79DRAFT_594244 [Colletotrichum navitas]